MIRKNHFIILAVALVACPFVLAATPVVPHVYHSGVELITYGAMQSRAATWYRNIVYLTSDSPTGQGATVFSVNAANPDSLSFVSLGGMGGWKANGLTAREDRLYVAGWDIPLRVFDISNPADFIEIAQFNPDTRYGWDVSVSGNRAYLAEDRELETSFYLMDINNPANPTLISNPIEMGSPAVHGSYSYYTNRNSTWFKVLNISDESNPYEMAAVNAGVFVGEIALRYPLAFVKYGRMEDSQIGMVVYNVSNPLQPVEIGRWVRPGNGLLLRGIYLLGPLAFFPTSGNGFFAVDIGDPTHPQVLAQSEVPGYALELCICGNGRFIYVGTNEPEPGRDYCAGLHAFEVLDADPDDAGPSDWSGCSLGEASWDLQYEADVLPPVADSGWKLVEGSEAFASASGGILYINDNSTAVGSKVKWTHEWPATSSRGATVITRARCNAYNRGTSPLSYLGNLILRDGKGEEAFSILSDRFRAAAGGAEVPLDGTAWHTYRITTQNQQFEAYIDESSVPALTGPLFTTAEARVAAVWIGSGSSAGTQDIEFDYVYCFSNGAVPPPPAANTLTPSVTVKVNETPGKGSTSGLVRGTARVHWSTDGGALWNTSADVVCPPIGPLGMQDRGWITASGIPFNQNSPVLNKLRFSIQDAAGNLGTSPTYTVRIAGVPPGPVTNLTARPADSRVTLTWTNPTMLDFETTVIRADTTGYPTGPANGTLVVEKPGLPGSHAGFIHTGLQRGTTYYYAAFARNRDGLYATAAQTEARAALPPDQDSDGDVDQSDFGLFQTCLSRTGSPVPTGCASADLDGDGDADKDDLMAFPACLGGANATPTCEEWP